MTCVVTGSAVLTWCMLLVNKRATNRLLVIEALKLPEVLLILNFISPIHGHNQTVFSRRQGGQFHIWVSQRSAEVLGYSFPAVEKALQDSTTAQHLKFEFARQVWLSFMVTLCLVVQEDKPDLNKNRSLYSGRNTDPSALPGRTTMRQGENQKWYFKWHFLCGC